MYYILVLSILLQIAATVWVLRLITLTGHRIAWILVSAGLLGMIYRRAYVLWQFHTGAVQPDITVELVGLGVSLVVLVGVGLIRPVFQQLQEANEKLVSSEERFRTVADFTYDWEYWRGPDGYFRYVSPSCHRVTGYPVDAFYQDPSLMERIVHPEDADMVADHLSREPVSGKAGRLDFRIIAADGTEHWIGHRCVPVTDESGQFLGTRASNRVIDVRKRAEAKLRDSRRLYQNLVEQSHAIVLELDLDGHVRFMNRFARFFFGFLGEKVRGRKASEFLLTDPAVAAGKPGNHLSEIEVRRSNERNAWLSLASSLSLDRQGRVVGVLLVGIDITARKAAEQLREDVERIVRHDLKSPLVGIVGLPQVMLKADNLTDRQREMLKVLEESGVRMMELINQSLALYKLESGTYDHQPVPTDWLEVVKGVVRGLEANREYAQPVEVYLNGTPVGESDSLVIPGDQTLLYGMAANLIKNALEAAGEAPVQVAFTRGEPAVMEVRNSQPVPEPVRESFFSKYTTDGKRNGTGLGTYSAKMAVDAHKGTIDMQTGDDLGTVVRVALPAS